MQPTWDSSFDSLLLSSRYLLRWRKIVTPKPPPAPIGQSIGIPTSSQPAFVLPQDSYPARHVSGHQPYRIPAGIFSGWRGNISSNSSSNRSRPTRSRLCQSGRLDTHEGWKPASSVKYLRSRHQGALNAKEISDLERSSGDNVSYNQSWRVLKA